MTELVGRLGDRLLAVTMPQTRAYAWCNFCSRTCNQLCQGTPSHPKNCGKCPSGGCGCG